jgi:hypothetical protein
LCIQNTLKRDFFRGIIKENGAWAFWGVKKY